MHIYMAKINFRMMIRIVPCIETILSVLSVIINEKIFIEFKVILQVFKYNFQNTIRVELTDLLEKEPEGLLENFVPNKALK